MSVSWPGLPPVDERRDTTDELSFRLAPSPGRGVGVFTTHAIRAGTRLALFPDGPGGMAEHNRFLTWAEIDRGSDLLKRFVDVYGIGDVEGAWLPRDFGQMHIGWYLNHDPAPNAHHDANYDYYASRDLLPGEEVFIDYNALGPGVLGGRP